MTYETNDIDMPDTELIDRFNLFIAQNAGKHVLKTCTVVMSVHEADDDDPEHEMKIDEAIGSNDSQWLSTHYTSTANEILKSVMVLTRSEEEALKASTEAKRTEQALDLAVEKAMTGLESDEAAERSMIVRRLTAPGGLSQFWQNLTREPDFDVQSANAIEITELLDNLEAAVPAKSLDR